MHIKVHPGSPALFKALERCLPYLYRAALTILALILFLWLLLNAVIPRLSRVFVSIYHKVLGA